MKKIACWDKRGDEEVKKTKTRPCQVFRPPDRASKPTENTKGLQLDYTTSFCRLTRTQSTRGDANGAIDSQRGCGPTGDVAAHAGH